MKIKAIALNTFKEAIRNKIYYLLLLFAIIFSLASKGLSMLAVGDKDKIILDTAMASVSFFSVLIAIFTGVNLLFKETDKKTIFNILSKSINRTYFVLGKFLGLALTLGLALISMSVILIVMLKIYLGKIVLGVLLYFLALYCELLIITAISIVFSSFSTPILSTVFTILLYLLAHVTWTFNLFKEQIPVGVTRAFAYIIYFILPNFEKFNIGQTIVLGEKISIFYIMGMIFYTFCYIVALLLLAVKIFNKKEF